MYIPPTILAPLTEQVPTQLYSLQRFKSNRPTHPFRTASQPSMGGMEVEDASIQIRLKAGMKEQTLRAADGVELSVPQKMGKKALRNLLQNLLNLPEDDVPEFQFLVSDEHPLRTTLGNYIQRRNLSTEITLEITYYISLPEPEKGDPQDVSDEWLSAIHAVCTDKPLIVTGSYSGAPSVVSGEHLVRESRSHAHSAVINGVAWVDGGETFLTASQDQTVQLWSCDVSDGSASPRAIFRSEEAGTPVSFSCISASETSNGMSAALGGVDGSVWTIGKVEIDGEEGMTKKRKSTEATRLSASQVGTGSNLRVTSAVFRGDNIVSAGWDGLARIWDTQRQSTVTVPCGGKAVTSLSVSENVMLASAVDGAVRIVDCREGKGVVGACGRSGAHSGIAADGCWLDEGLSAASGGLDGTIRLWDLRAIVAPMRVVEEVHGGGRCLAVCAVEFEGRRCVFSGGQDGKVATLRV